MEKSSTTHSKASKRKASKKKTTKKKTSRTADIEEVKQSAEDPAVDDAIVDFEMIKYDDEIKPSTILFPQHQLKVENLGNMNKSWPETVFIDKETFSGWGGRFTAVNIQTNVGKELRCKVMPSGNSRKGTILMAKEIQLKLEVKRGELVSVEPSILLVPENKTNDIVQTFYGFKKG